jgi:hypothetical protein
MYFVSKKLKKKYNITDERAALYEAAETWVDALNGREFLGMHLSLYTLRFFYIYIYMIVRIYDPCVNPF